MNKKYQKEWAKADSLAGRGLPQSAAEVVRKILKDAEAQKDNPNVIKARLFLLDTDNSRDENAGPRQIKEATSYIASSSGVEKAIWQSITAEMYWNYFQQNRWKMYNRTAMAETKSDDIDTWDAPAFVSKVADLYKASVADRALLKGVPVEKYQPILVEGVNTRKLRPSVYDLLIFRAIGFFQNEEKDMVNPAYQFTVEGSKWFDEASRFSQLRIKVADPESLHFQALMLYQEIIASHLNDPQPDALIDADLQRLAFVCSKSVDADKEDQYLKALKRLEQQYAGIPAVAQVSYLILQQQMGNEEVQPYGRKIPGTKARRKNRDLPGIKAKLQALIARYPGTEGAINAHNLVRSLETVSIEVKTEEVNLPGENIKALLSYRNRDKVYLKLYRIPNTVKIDGGYSDRDVELKRFANMAPLRSWEQPLPGSSDMEQHSTEVKVEALPEGAYVLLAATSASLQEEQTIITVARFQVSAISFVLGAKGETQGYLLHRKTGYPVPGVRAIFWSQQYSNKQNRYIARQISTANGSAEGLLRLPATQDGNYEDRLAAITLTAGKDTLQLNGYFGYGNYYAGPDITRQTRTFFFTDRSIYRPGQTIYFKGIILESSDKGKSNRIKAGEKTTVHLYDANSQQVQTLELTTNEYGSFTGKFTAPETGLTGQMRIQDQHGSVYFSVEEYKRPKFYVEYDTLKADYALNREVKVKGFAKAYAGNNIDGAAIKYRVVRRARFPYYWCYYFWGMPSSPEVEIANGTAVTAGDGSFTVSFQTLPDKSVEPKTLPVFTYEVYADITDINGETRSGSISVSAGYRSLQIDAALAEESRPSELNTIAVRTTNLNGVFLPAKVNISIAALKFPGFYRKRLWEVPDQYVMNEQEFRAAFPADEYKEEGSYLNWEKGKVLHEQTLTTTADGKVNIPEATWYQNGWYVIEISTKDAGGNEILEKKYTHVWAPGKKEQTQKPLVIYTDKDSYQPGDDLEVWRGTAVDNPYVLVQAEKVGKELSVGREKNPLKFKLTEEDRGGMVFSWLYISENRVYTVSQTINIPWSNKDLELEWATHRDKLQPGAADEWTITIKGNKKEKVAAELLAGMYDASLDAFKPHSWNWSKLFPSVYATHQWNGNYGFGIANGEFLKYIEQGEYQSYEKRYDELIGSSNAYEGDYGWNSGRRRTMLYANAPSPVAANKSVESADAASLQEIAIARKTPSGGAPVTKKSADVNADEITEAEVKEKNTNTEIMPRKNLQETAFFFPQLATDADGNVKIKFTMPEALTEWKFMAFAHTKEWQTAYLQGSVKTQKDLMVVPNLPRFLRQKDDIVISTKISNLSDAALNGEARLELLDAATMQPLELPFRLKENKQNFSVAKGQSTTATWAVHVPESRYTPVVVRIVAKADNFSDGEETTLPVVTNRMLVTETLPMPVRGNQEKTFTLDKLLHQNSSTLANHALTVEFTGNPAWYAVQALPYLMEYPYECAEQTFNRYYANALAGHIAGQSPKVEQIFNQWKDKDTAALLSNLQKNEELKSALLEETPWVLDAKDESEQKRRIAALFATHKLAKELNKNLDKLQQMQLGEGGFPWFKGMRSDRYITQYITTGLARLQHLKVKTSSGKDAMAIVERALPYLDRQLKEDYDNLVKYKAKLSEQQIGYIQVQYLYMRSFYSNKPVPAATQKAFDYYKQQAAKYWSRFNPYLKGQIALALNRMGDAKTATQVMASLRETATQKEEMGMYWVNMPSGYWWYEAPIEAQSLLIEAFAEVAKDDAATDALKVWLLKQKQTQNWKTTKATADACYALLLQGSSWLSATPLVTINVGNEVIRSGEIKTEAGTGYFKKRFEGRDVIPEMGTVKVKVDNQQNKNEGVSWGAIYWQYFEDLDKITGAATPLSLKKQLFIERNTDRGPVLTEIKEGNELKVGDKVKVRIELRVDRDMEYVHMKDMRAACMEPVNVLSGYRYQGGLGYYESTKDIATNFFFDYLRKGTYVFEYPVFVSAKGNFSNGITTIQCMYAPEFSSHSEGIRVSVK
jgi:uncharacterized protein YfaS (alpha-2-macroglobulin family)